MEGMSAFSESWNVLETMFPRNWRVLAKETNALVRKLRSFTDEDSVMRTLLLHVGNGYSLRETAVRAKISKIADVTDVALLKRLQCSEDWFKSLCMSLLKERGFQTEIEPSTIRMRIVDGTIVKEPGKTGSHWRIHYSLQLPNLHCDYFKLTAFEGNLTGETFKQFPVKKGDCIMGDRGYSTAQGIAYLSQQEAFCLVRVNTSSLNFYQIRGKIETKFDLLSKVMELKEEKQSKQWEVWIQDPSYGLIKGRICAIRKSQIAADSAIAKLKKRASKSQKILKPKTLEFAKYIIIFTTLPIENFTSETILEWYRLRWQIELVFKRLKSLAGFGHLPKYDDASARAWLYGKLFVGLLTEKLIYSAKMISPWGYYL